MKSEEIIDILNLKPLPTEGGFFIENYQADESFEVLPSRYHNERRCFSTAIYYLLTPDTISAMHKLPSDEVFHFYAGDLVEMLQLFPDGKGKVIKIGSDLKAGLRPQVVVPRGTWQGSRLAAGGQFALLGTTVAPGFAFTDFEAGAREMLVDLYPEYENLICQLTRQ
ncbi:MAG TPA: cupin domain-containing protein [Terriglobales bacterium]|nr:cupin domain-containing protein [Terriglobales bacterium]